MPHGRDRMPWPEGAAHRRCQARQPAGRGVSCETVGQRLSGFVALAPDAWVAPCPRRRARAAIVHLRLLLTACLWASPAACTDSGAGDKSADLPGDAGGEGACHPARTRTDGSCCAAGSFYDYASDACLTAGPPECASDLFSAPSDCVPRWCEAWTNSVGEPCKRGEAGCMPDGRLCSAAELAANSGCPSGATPRPPPGQGCVPAGSFSGSGVPADWSGDAPSLPPVPPLATAIPEGVPPLTAMPEVDDTFFCVDKAGGGPRFCTADEAKVCARLADGRLPDPSLCRHPGVSWPSRVCPPGFLPEEPVSGQAATLAACKPDPADCGQDDYGDPSLKDGPDVVFVHATAGDDQAKGTRAAPLRTIAQAIAKVPPGGTVALAAGGYSGAVTLTKALTLRGRCAAMVKISNSQTSEAIVHLQGGFSGAKVVIEGIHFAGGGRGIQSAAAVEAVLRRLWVQDVHTFGLLLEGHGVQFTVSSSVIAGTLPHLPSNQAGAGAVVVKGARLRLKDVRLSRNHHEGVRVQNAGSTLQATGVLVDDTLPQTSDAMFGRGIAVYSGGRVELAEVRLSGNRDTGLSISGAGSLGDAAALLVDATRAAATPEAGGGNGVVVQDGARLGLSETRVSGNRQSGVWVVDAGSRLEATRLIVDQTRSRKGDQRSGIGLMAQSAVEVSLSDARLSANREAGLIAAHKGTTVVARRLLVDGTEGQALDNAYGMGAVAAEGAYLSLQDARLTSNRYAALLSVGAASAVTVERALIDGTRSHGVDGDLGAGAVAQGGGKLVGADLRLSGNREVALMVSDKGTEATLLRLLVDGTLVGQAAQPANSGVQVQDGARLTVRDARISGSNDAGLLVIAADALASGLLVDGGRPATEDNHLGRGVSLQDDGSLRIIGAAVLDNTDSGLVALRSQRLRAVGVSVLGTRARADGSMGMGVSLDVTHGPSELLSCRIAGNRSSAMGVHAAGATIDNSALLDTAGGTYPEIDPAGIPTGAKVELADGLVLDAVPTLRMRRCVIAGHKRAGVLASAVQDAEIASTLLTGSLYGMAVKEGLAPKVEGCLLYGNGTNLAGGKTLALPPPPIAAEAGKPVSW